MGAKTRGNYPVAVCLRIGRCMNANKMCGECFRHQWFCTTPGKFREGDFDHVEKRGYWGKK